MSEESSATEVVRLEDLIRERKKELDHIQDQIVMAEDSFSKRSVELKTIVHALEKTVRQLTGQIQQYELGMRDARKKDEQHKAELEALEADLKARERVLYQQRSDFDHRVKRFNQIRELKDAG